MKKLFLMLIVACYCSNIMAQDAVITDLKKESEKVITKDPTDTIVKKWKKGGTFNLNVNQGSLSNWAAGGDKFSFSLNAYLNLYAFYKKDKHAWDNSLDLNYGIVKTTSLGRRKSSDRIDLVSKYGYAISKKMNVASLFNLRSQFANGFSYAKDAQGVETPTLISRSFQPTYIILSQGFDWRPKDNFSLFFSPITAKWILVSDSRIKRLYTVDSSKNVRSEFGAFLSVNYSAKIGKSFTYKTKLDLFSNYKKEPKNIDIYWTNAIAAKITKYINFTFNVDMIYDNDTKNVEPGKGPAPQWLQLMGIGFVYKMGNSAK